MIDKDDQKQFYKELKSLYEKREEYQNILRVLKERVRNWSVITNNSGFYEFDMSDDTILVLVRHYKSEIKKIDKQIKGFKINKIKET